MKTNLDRTINSPREAIEFLKDLKANNELWNPDDDVYQIIWDGFTPTETDLGKMQTLMESVWNYLEDPHAFMLESMLL